MAVNSFRQDEDMKAMSTSRIVRRLFGYLKDYPRQLVIIIFVMAVAVGINLLNPLLIEYALDSCIAQNDIPALMRLLVVTIIVNLIYIVAVRNRTWRMSLVAHDIVYGIRKNAYEHLQTLSFTYFDSLPTGKILARIISDVSALKEVLQQAVVNIIPNTLTIIGVLVIMFIKDWRLALASFCTIPFMGLALFFIQRTNHKRWHQVRKKASNLNAYLHEDIAGIRVVQSFVAEEETKEQFGNLSNEFRNSFVYACTVSDMFMPVTYISWGIGSMMLYLAGVKWLGAPTVSVGMLVAFGTYTSMFWNPIAQLSGFFNQLITNLSTAERVFDLLDTPATIVDAPDAVDLPEVEGRVEFSHVSFTYDEGTENETKVLDDVSFSVEPGQTIALVGPTGAGKTTIVNLISRFYDIQKGSITLDGYDLRQVTIKSLRKQMGVMTQDNFIFHGTVHENIAYGKTGATREKVIEAAKAVNAHDFIMLLENGYDTELKEQGAGLSIGQRQLIAFARTMLVKPRVLILDEATSSIDTHTEQLVQQGIAALLANRTSFVIAHRLSTIQYADRIYVLDEGGILEQGTPAELMEAKGAYYKLYMAQFEGMRD